MRPESGFRIAPNRKNDNDITICRHEIIVFFFLFFFFWRCLVSLVKFSYWSKFHVNIIAGSVVMTILFDKGLTRNPEIGNTPVWVLPNIWKLGKIRDSKLNVSNEMLLNAAKCQGYSFYRFWVIEGKPARGQINYPHPPTQIRVNKLTVSFKIFLPWDRFSWKRVVP